MTPNELVELKKGIVMMAAYYDKNYPDGSIAMMAEDLKEFSFAEVSAAYKRYRLDPKNRVMPLPAQIIDMIRPQVNHEAKAREIASRIPHAITKFGWANPEEARQYIGEVGWNVVQTSGGWSYLCQNHGVTIDPGQFMAQTRDRLRDQFQFGRDAINQQVIEHRPKEERIQLEARDQRARLEQWQIDEIEKNKKPDPNADYIAKTPEERQAILDKFIKDLANKKGKGA